MGTVNIVFAKAATSKSPVYNGGTIAAEDVTSSGTSAQSSATGIDCIARITADVDIYIKTGPNPTAAAGEDWRLAAGSALDLALNEGDKVAVIDA